MILLKKNDIMASYKIGVVKESEQVEYSGILNVNRNNETFTCTYNLVNENDNQKSLNGSFNCSENSLAKIIGQLHNLINIS